MPSEKGQETAAKPFLAALKTKVREVLPFRPKSKPPEVPNPIPEPKLAPDEVEVVLQQSYGETKPRFKDPRKCDLYAALVHNIYEFNGEVNKIFNRNRELNSFHLRFTIYVNRGIGGMWQSLYEFLRLAREDPDYQRLLGALKDHLPDEFYVYRSQSYERGIPSGIINYTVKPEIADKHLAREAKWDKFPLEYPFGANIERVKISKDQIVALGSSSEYEVIVDISKETEPSVKA